MDDRVLISSKGDTRTEHLGTRSSYLYQLEAFVKALRGGAPIPTGPGRRRGHRAADRRLLPRGRTSATAPEDAPPTDEEGADRTSVAV
jgi:hypothetical protein